LRALKDFGGGTMDDLRGRFDELDAALRRARSLFGDLQRDFDSMFQNAPPGTSTQSRAESYSIRMTPDGVEVDIEENVDGQRKTQTYKAARWRRSSRRTRSCARRSATGRRCASSTRAIRSGDSRAAAGPPSRSRRRRRARCRTRTAGGQPAQPQAKPGKVRTDVLGFQYTTPTEEMSKKLVWKPAWASRSSAPAEHDRVGARFRAG
jgi:hypothetical protein